MTVIVTEEQLDDPEVILSIDEMIRRGTRPNIIVGGFEYSHTTAIARKKAEADIPNKILKGLLITGMTFWVEVPTTATDNKVPAGWPDRMIADPVDPKKEISKRWDQYTVIIYGINGNSLLLCEHQKIPKGMRDKTTNAEIKKYVKLFADNDANNLIFGDKLTQWKLDNTPST